MEHREGNEPPPSIFTGVRVIDFTHILAGPYCTKLMADMGADVIKVEQPVTGDEGRGLPQIKNGGSAFFAWRNAGKKSVSVDLKRPGGAELFTDLVRISDVLVQNRRVGAMERLGLGWDDLSKINPKLVMCSISGYGQYGPLSDWPANDANIQAQTGVTWLSGHPDGPPLPSWIPWVDFSTGTHALAAITSALYYVKVAGIGQHIDVAMMDCALNYHDFALQEYLATDGQVERTRSGPYHPSLALLGVYKCQDGYLFVRVTPRSWPAMAELLGQPELAQDPRFDTRLHRNEHREELYRMIADWIEDYTVEDARIVLHENGVLSLNILSPGEVVNHPQVQAREMLVEVDDPQLGRFKVINTPFKFSATKAGVRGRAPLLGEHNDDVLSNVLGYSPERVADLWERKVLYAEPMVSGLNAR